MNFAGSPTDRKRNRPSRSKLSCAALLILFATALQAADNLRITPLVRDGQVLLSFEIVDGFTQEVRDAIYSGLRTTVTYDVELRMEVPAWIDRTIASAIVTNTVQYDTLTRRHQLSRMLDGRVEDARVTEEEAAVRQWLTTLEKMPLFRTSKLEANREYYVRVRVSSRPRNTSLLWPWGGGLSGQVKFTFIP